MLILKKRLKEKQKIAVESRKIKKTREIKNKLEQYKYNDYNINML